MDWKRARRSDNIEDRRGSRRSFGRGGGTGLMRLIPMLLSGRFGKMGFLVAGGIVVYQLFFAGPATQQVASSSINSNVASQDQSSAMVASVLGLTEDVWQEIFKELGRRYEEPKLVLFRNQVSSACGRASAAVGPFYCPADKKVYLDLSFFDQLSRDLGAQGDFAQAYVIAHEVGHHVQNLLGISAKVDQMSRQSSPKEKNQLSVLQELQADCFAGLWAAKANRLEGFIEKGDYEEAIEAAGAIGDDRLQQRSQGYVRPDSFTHGSSAQRISWFRKGLNAQSLRDCDSFAR